MFDCSISTDFIYDFSFETVLPLENDLTSLEIDRHFSDVEIFIRVSFLLSFFYFFYS